MKKYFFGKALVWQIILAVITTISISITTAACITIPTILGGGPKETLATVVSLIMAFAMIVLGVFSGKILAKRLAIGSTSEVNFSKYQYFYYIAFHSAEMFFIALGNIGSAIVFKLMHIASAEDQSAIMILKNTALPQMINTLFTIIGLIIGARFVSSLLCAVCSGEDDEKSFFNKAFVPIVIGFAGAIALYIVGAIVLDYSALGLVRNALDFVIFAAIFYLLKNKLDDEKTRKIATVVLPMVYIGICAITTGIDIVQTL